MYYPVELRQEQGQQLCQEWKETQASFLGDSTPQGQSFLLSSRNLF